MFVEEEKNVAWKAFFQKRFHSPLLRGKSHSRKIAYLGLLTAFSVVANALFEIKLGEIQFSLTLFVGALIGMLAGGGYGFVVCFLGDTIGFFLHPFGAYLPMLSVSAGLTALFSGVCLSYAVDKSENEPTAPLWKTVLAVVAVCLLSFTVCTVGITHTTFFYLYANGRSYWAYFVYRFVLQGQLYNCIFNYALIFLSVPILKKLMGKVKNR